MKIIEKLKAYKKAAVCGLGGIIAILLIVFAVIITGKRGDDELSETENKAKSDNNANEVLQYIFSDEDISRGEWIKLYSEKFGMCNYVTEEPFFSDISKDNEIFAYVQTCVENDVLFKAENLYADEKISLREAITQLGKTYGQDYISRRIGKETLENDDYLEYILSNNEIKQYCDNPDKGFNKETAQAILDIVWESYINREWQNDSNIVYAKGVIDLSDVTEYTYDGNTVNLKTDKEIKQGEIIILGATKDWEDGLALRVSGLSKNNGSYAIKTEVPELQEVIESMYVEMDRTADFSDFIPGEGVTVVESSENANRVSNLYNSRLDTINVLSDIEFDKSHKGNVIKLEVNFSDEDLKISPEYEKYGIKAELKDYFLDKNGNLQSKFEKGVDIKGSITLSDLILQGSIGYNDKVRFDVNTGFKVNTGLKVEGNAKGKEFLLGKVKFKLAFGLSAEMNIYLKVDFEGSISVSASITDTLNIKKSYDSGINTTAKSEFDNSTEIEAMCKVLLGPDFVLKAFAIPLPIADIYVYIGLKSQTKWSQDNPLEITVESYGPIIEAGVGEQKDTILNKLGVKVKVAVMDIEKAILKSPLISTITFNLFDGRVAFMEGNTTEGQNEENSDTESTTTKATTGEIIAEEKTTENKPTENNTEKPDSVENNTESNVTIVASGNRWKLDSEGTFTYFGEGDMPREDYSCREWTEYLENIKKIIIEDGVTSIGAIGGLTRVECTVEQVIIPSSVKVIEEYAFCGCNKLKELTIPNGVYEIGHAAFANCSALEKVNIPTSVKIIKDSVFQGTNLKEIIIPDSVISIEAQAFYECRCLESIIIPNNVTSIESEAFAMCSKLTSVLISSSETNIESHAFEFTPWLEAKQKENPLVIINNILIDAQSTSGEVVIPNGVTRIVDYAFSGYSSCSSLTSITIPDSVTSIGEHAFNGCSNISIYGKSGSTAEKYANENGIAFEVIQ